MYSGLWESVYIYLYGKVVLQYNLKKLKLMVLEETDRYVMQQRCEIK